MIYAQKLDATVCAEYGLWNDKMNKYARLKCLCWLYDKSICDIIT